MKVIAACAAASRPRSAGIAVVADPHIVVREVLDEAEWLRAGGGVRVVLVELDQRLAGRHEQPLGAASTSTETLTADRFRRMRCRCRRGERP